MTPFISAICPVYGRVRLLQEAIACFIRQDYKGPCELIILNSLPVQKLVGKFPPNIRIINLDKRPGSLGECRNMAIEAARGDVIVTWDSDDLFLPGYLTLLASKFDEDIQWVWLAKQFYADKFRIKEVMAGQLNSVAFTKDAWEKVGGYAQLTVGEDRQFVGRLTAETKGVKVSLAPHEVQFIYSWGNNTYKTSGYGDDKSQQLPAYERVAHEVRRQIEQKKEPKGTIILQPILEHDPVAMAKDFLEARGLLVQKKDAVCIVELGRFGDIVNILPIAQHIAELYGKPHMMVSREFASILEGVSYVEPYIVDLPYDAIIEAMALARKEFKYVIQGQIWGKNYTQQKLCRSYNEESWRQCGFWRQFSEKKMLPLFDRRDKERESALVNKLSITGKPLLLVNVTKSVSSPFPFGEELLELIRDTLNDAYEVIDIAELKANKIFDLIGLMDAAALVISIDTAILHLAAASAVPVLAIVNPNPWAGSILRCNEFLRVDYNHAKEFPMNIYGNINALSKRPSYTLPGPHELFTPPVRRVFHCVERHDETNPTEALRKRTAWDSWDVLYNAHGVIPCHLWAPYARDARSIGDRRPLPFLKDVLQQAMDQAGDEDIIFWCNDDNILHPDLPELLKFHCSVYEVCTSRRMEFKKNPFPRGLLAPSEYAKLGEHHIGRDVFAATKRWLTNNWDEFPDVVLGEPLFDLHLASMVRYHFGYKSDRKSLFLDNIFPCELPLGYVSHVFHTPKWTQERAMTNGRRRNSNLFKEWVTRSQVPLTFTAQGDI